MTPASNTSPLLEVDVAVVGAGPHALAVLAALRARPEPWPLRVAVIDPRTGWAQAWDEKLARLSLDRLRSPQVHHPGPRPMALRDLVEAREEGEQLALRRPEDERVPTPAGMRVLIDGLVDGLGPVVRRKASVTHVDPASPGRAVLALDDGTRISAGAAVLAHNPSWPRVPEWAPTWIERGVAVHASDVDLRAEVVRERHVAIVGGGLTAGSLACEVLRRGGHVTLLTRRPLRARPYDVDASWLGPRRLRAFGSAGPDERRAMIDLARDGGTMPPRVLAELREAAATSGSGLVIREAVDVPSELDALLISAASDDDCTADAGRPVDAVWLATGFENDVHRDPLVGPLVDTLGVQALNGLPVVDDDLRLAGSPVFVTGPYAALGVGPAARNLAGARPAAARIAAAIAAR